MNSFDLVTKMLPLLDEVYISASKTAVLDVAPNRIQFDGTKNIKIYKTTMDGLGDYDRAGGYKKGNVTGTWETLTLNIDRGRSFTVDTMDNDETLMMAFGTLSGEFIRTKVVPELDAIRFAKYASASGNLVATPATLTKADIIDALEAAIVAMDNAEIPPEGRVLWLTPDMYSAMKQTTAVSRFISPAQSIDRRFEEFDGMKLVKVPQARFYTAIDLLDGVTEDEEAGGFAKSSTGKDINFMITHPASILQITKHAKPRVFDPDTNQDADAWKMDYRIYHDAFTQDNKAKGIYVHHKA